MTPLKSRQFKMLNCNLGVYFFSEFRLLFNVCETCDFLKIFLAFHRQEAQKQKYANSPAKFVDFRHSISPV